MDIDRTFRIARSKCGRTTQNENCWRNGEKLNTIREHRGIYYLHRGSLADSVRSLHISTNGNSSANISRDIHRPDRSCLRYFPCLESIVIIDFSHSRVQGVPKVIRLLYLLLTGERLQKRE
jgi:hypothetical protein